MVGRKGSFMVSRSQAQPIKKLAHLDLRQVLQFSRRFSTCIYAPRETWNLLPCGATDREERWGRQRAIKLPSLSTVREGRPPRSSFIGAL